MKWATTTTGKAMPLDERPSLEGNVALRRDGMVAVLGGEDLRAARARGDALYMPHHATCPQAALWKAQR